VQLRIGVRSPDKAMVERFTRELAPLILNGRDRHGFAAAGEGRGDRGVLPRWCRSARSRVVKVDHGMTNAGSRRPSSSRQCEAAMSGPARRAAVVSSGGADGRHRRHRVLTRRAAQRHPRVVLVMLAR